MTSLALPALRDCIKAYYGSSCEIVTLRPAEGRSAFLYVVDATFRGRPLRTLGTIGRDGTLLDQSAMDLLRPERLVFAYERLMLVAFALVPEPRRALLLGLGGGAMYRHLKAYLPDCAVTVVDRSRAIIELARRHFYITDPVRRADAEEVVADAREAFDVVLVDLFDAQGIVSMPRSFWRDCVSALRPGGCVAINWADFHETPAIREELDAMAPDLGRYFFAADQGLRPNLVQYAPTAAGFRIGDLEHKMRDFAGRFSLPIEDRRVLRRSRVSARLSGTRRRSG